MSCLTISRNKCRQLQYTYMLLHVKKAIRENPRTRPLILYFLSYFFVVLHVHRVSQRMEEIERRDHTMKKTCLAPRLLLADN